MALVLLVDDDIQIREVLAEMIRDAGHEVVAVSDGKYVKGAFINGQYDVLITDIVMPEQDGLKTIQQIKALFPNIRIIGISGGDRSFTGETYLDIARNFGAHRTLRKPFTTEVLLATIDEVLAL